MTQLSFTIQTDPVFSIQLTVSSSLTPYWFNVMLKNQELDQALNSQLSLNLEQSCMHMAFF